MSHANNPFKFKLESRMKTSERVESVAYVLYERYMNAEDTTYGWLLKYFPTWSMDTIKKGVDKFNTYIVENR